MRKLLLILFISGTCLAQRKPDPLPCGTPAPTMEQIKQAENTYTYFLKNVKTARNKAGVTNIPVKFLIIRKLDGTGGVDYGTINAGLARLNGSFSPSDIQFYIAPDGLTEVKSDRLFDINTSEMRADMYTVMKPDAINIFLVNSGRDSVNPVFGGQAPLPTPSAESNWAVMNVRYLTDGYLFAHEMGHYFSLYHPHDNSGRGVDELVNGSNCANAGDYVCDTPADPYDLLKLPLIIPQPICTYSYDLRDANGQLYKPLLNNVMGYWRCAPFTFTTGQHERVKTIGLAGRVNPANQYTLNAPASDVTPRLLSVIAGGGPVKLSWEDKSVNETGFIIERSTQATDGFIAVDGVAPNVNQWLDNSALSGVSYYYRVKASNSLNYSNVQSGKQGYCLPVHRDSYSCTSAEGTIGLESFTIWSAGKVAMLLDSKGVCNQDGNAYSDLTNRPAIKLTAGASYPFQVEAMRIQAGQSKGSIYATRINIWIDLNQDQVFSGDERLYLSPLRWNSTITALSGEYPNPFISNQFVIPFSAKTGLTRMRVRIGTPVFTGNLETPCEQIDGETEDYLVDISSNCTLLASVTGSATICQGSSTTLVATGTGGQGTLTYAWKAGNTAVGTNSATLSAAGAGVYTVSIADASGCASTATFSVAGSNPVPSFKGDVLFCEGTTTTLNASATGGIGAYNFAWKRDGITVGQGSSVTLAQPGTVILEATDQLGCIGRSGAFTVGTKPSPPNVLITSSSLDLLPNGTVSLSANAGVGLTYQWNLGGNAIDGATTALYQTQRPGVYTVSVNKEGCVTTSPAVTVNLITATEPVTAGVSLLLYPNPSSGWATVSLVLDKPAKVTLRLTDAAGRNLYEWRLATTRISHQIGVDLSTLVPGVYVLKADVEGRQLIKRFVRE